MFKKLISIFAFIVFLSAANISLAQEWSRFRGLNGQGHSPSTKVSATWTADDYKWTTTLPGGGKELIAVKPRENGKPAKVLYTIKNNTVLFVSTSLIVQQRLYTFHDNGTVACRKLETGEPYWTENQANFS